MKSNPRVLIIDDNVNMRETMSDILQEKGYDVVTAGTALEGQQAAAKSFFNIHLIDINLPDKTGIDILRSFKSMYPTRINIMVTASATLKYAVDALNAGADAYVLKPVDFLNLEHTMKECLRKQQPTIRATEDRLAEFIASPPQEAKLQTTNKAKTKGKV
jgi:DNA-binding response OmpR family regulator